MSSYRKYIMMGATTILLPLGKLFLRKIMEKVTEKPEEDYNVEENAKVAHIRRA